MSRAPGPPTVGHTAHAEATDEGWGSMSTTVAVLGTGTMGTGMATNLITDGFDVRVWNRTPDKTFPLGELGAHRADSPTEAVEGADVIVTTLFDEAATREVMEEALDAAAPGTVWVQSGTVGVNGTELLASLADRAGVPLVDAPVLGTRKPAEEGTLVTLAAGTEDALTRTRPVMEAYSSRILRVGEAPGPASALKLACNAWVTTVTAGVAQSLAMARSMGVDPQLFLDAISGGALDVPYAHIKGEAMLNEEHTPSFTVHGALKDLDLMVDNARRHGVAAGVLEGVRIQFKAAERSGHRDADIAAVYEAVLPSDDSQE